MALREMLTVDGISKKDKQKLITRRILSGRSMFSLGKDIYQAWRAVK